MTILTASTTNEASVRPVLRLGLLGVGNVGQGVIDVLTRNGGEIERRAGQAIRVVAASRRNVAALKALADAGVRTTDDPGADWWYDLGQATGS
jgi:homoserine dehydrogenase